MYIFTARVWPYPVLKEVMAFVAGHPAEETSIAEKLENDLDIKPSRHIEKTSGLAEFTPNEDAREITGLPLNPRRKNPRMFLSPDAPRGYRVIYGAFDFTDSRHGAILIDPDSKIANIWQVSQDGLPWKHLEETNVFPHGFEIARDGSIAVSFDSGSSLIKYDYCGNRVWARSGGFHHSIKFDGNGALWAWGDVGKPQSDTIHINGQSLMKIDYASGKLSRIFDIVDIIRTNDQIDILGILQDDSGPDSRWLGPDGDVWHGNDIEPLPESLVRHYKDFNAGDLLVSFREPDIIFVMDPKTLKVKWWRQGLARRQHDPDWNDKGTITIFNNNTNRSYSNIMELDPVTMKHRVLLDGADYQLYTKTRGTHQYLPGGGLLITSPQQGRVLEVDSEGNVLFEFLNIYGKDAQGAVNYMPVSDARLLPEDFFVELPKCD